MTQESMPNPTDYLSKIQDALKMRPDSLMAVSAVFLTAMLIHHRALSNQNRTSFQQISECGCEDCLGRLPDLLGQNTIITVDTVRLLTMLETLQDIECWRPAEEEHLSEAMSSISNHLKAEYLEKLFRKEGHG